MPDSSKDGTGCYIEFIPQGAYVKVSAIDPRTGTEASIVGNARSSQAELTRLAKRKLDYVLKKRAEG